MAVAAVKSPISKNHNSFKNHRKFSRNKSDDLQQSLLPHQAHQIITALKNRCEIDTESDIVLARYNGEIANFKKS